jgi:5-methylcytosine-specific restriction endonuclease McrA/predicted nucleic acid-binding Zn ribbon protein
MESHRTCERCAAAFPATTQVRRFCSEQCRRLTERARSRSRELTQLIRCARCAQQLEARDFAPSARKPGAYCRACQSEYMRERSLRRPCRDCNEVGGLGWWVGTYKHPGSAGPRCKPCYLAYVRRRQTPNTTRPSSKPKQQSEFGKPTGKRWNEVRAAVIAEESHCGFCGVEVDKSLRFPDPMSATVDHIVPWSQGGHTYARSNLRLAHFRCNAAGDNRSQATLTKDERAVLNAYRESRKALVDVRGLVA